MSEVILCSVNPRHTINVILLNLSFSHRHPSSHSCQVVDAPKSQRSASARALLAKNFPTSSRKKAAPQRTTNIPTEPIKLARHRKAELIRMRHRAAPGNPVDNSYTPQDQRLHLRLQIDEQTEKVFWFCKVCTMIGQITLVNDPAPRRP
jgi:hypothetical protein